VGILCDYVGENMKKSDMLQMIACMENHMDGRQEIRDVLQRIKEVLENSRQLGMSRGDGDSKINFHHQIIDTVVGSSVTAPQADTESSK
jgi:hypothetical protein